MIRRWDGRFFRNLRIPEAPLRGGFVSPLTNSNRRPLLAMARIEQALDRRCLGWVCRVVGFEALVQAILGPKPDHGPTVSIVGNQWFELTHSFGWESA